MAEDEQDRGVREEERQEDEGYGYEEELREQQRATYGELTDESRERIADTVEERVRREEEREDQGRGRAFSKDQIVHEAAIMVRGMYGTPKFKLELDDSGELGAGNYMQRTEEAGYYDLVDCWAVASHRLDLKYHSAFLKRATPLKWGSRANRYLIPNYYVFGMDGVDRAINEEYISPLFSHKLKYRLTVHLSLPFIVAGPPVAYYDWLPIGPSKGEALALAKLEEGEGESTALEGARRELQMRAQEVREKKEDVKRRARELEKVRDTLEEAKKSDSIDETEYQRREENAEMSLVVAKKDLESAYEEFQELKEEVESQR